MKEKEGEERSEKATEEPDMSQYPALTNEPKNWPAGVQTLKEEYEQASPEEQKRMRDLQDFLHKKIVPLAPLAEDAKLPSWKEMPPLFKEEYGRWLLKNKMKKDWDDWSEDKKRSIYNHIAMKTRRPGGKLFPRPGLPVEVPAQPLAASTPTTTVPQAPTGRMTEPVSSPVVRTAPPSKPDEAAMKAEIERLKKEKDKEVLKQIPKHLLEKPVETEGDITEVQIKPPKHADFIAELEAISSEPLMIQAVKIIRYANEIEGTYPDESKNLRVLASNLLRS